MRKLSLIAANIFLAATVLFTSCKKDDEEANAPTVNFIAGDQDNDYVTSDATVAPGGSFQVKLNVLKGDKDMDNIMVSLSGGNAIPASGISFSDLEDSNIDGPMVTLKGGDQKDFNTVITITTPDATGTLTYTFTVTDKDAEVTSKSVTIKIAVPGEVTQYTAKLLGAQSASAGSYFASSTGKVYTGSEFEANKSIIDITYAQTGSIVVSDKLISSDSRDEEGLTKGLNGLVVYYKKSALDYDNVTVEQIQDIEASSDQSLDIEVGDKIEFVTENGSKGLILINDIVNPNDLGFEGELTISVKVLK